MTNWLSKEEQMTTRGRGALIAGMAGAAALFGIFHGAKVDNHQATVNKELSQPWTAVQQELQTGKLAKAGVIEIDAPESGAVYNVAQDVAKPSDLDEAARIMSAQSHGTNEVAKGEPIYLPTNDVKTGIAENSNSANR